MSTTALYSKPGSLDEAIALLASAPARILSGGTDFYPSLGDRVIRGRVVDISALASLRGIAQENGFTRIGGLTTWTDIIRSPLPSSFDALKGAAREVGSVQIQNRGTVAGNLCNASPAADGVPPLLALDAAVELTSHVGVRRIPLADFIVGNRRTQCNSSELLTAVLVPQDMDDANSFFLKLGARRYLVISISMVAVVLRIDSLSNCSAAAEQRVLAARVAVGSCSAVAQRLRNLENDLVGRPINNLHSAVQLDHVTQLTPIDDVRATAEYRIEASMRLVKRALQLCAEKNSRSRENF